MNRRWMYMLIGCLLTLVGGLLALIGLLLYFVSFPGVAWVIEHGFEVWMVYNIQSMMISLIPMTIGAIISACGIVLIKYVWRNNND